MTKDTATGGPTPSAEKDATRSMVTLASVVMTEPPGPTSQFVELEDENGQSMRLDAGWEARSDGTWALRIPVWLGQYGSTSRPGVCRDCGEPFVPVQRGECSRCGSDGGPVSRPAGGA